MPETIPIAEAKARLVELIERIAEERERIVITRDGRTAAVLLSAEELGSLEETIEVLQEPGLLASIRRSRAEAEDGTSLPLR